jgi:tRNA (guanine-N7-)-methyltransferase
VGHALRPHHKALLKDLLPRVAVPDEGPIDLARLFPQAEGFAFEIGFGGGEHLAFQAALHPKWGFIGAEPFVNGVAKGLAHIEALGLSNVRLCMGDARDILERLPSATLDAVYVMHPDPWPKLRHHKRRVIQQETLAHIVRVLKPSGELRLATDVPDYADWTLMQVMRRSDLRFCADGPVDWLVRPADWPETRYGQKARAAGREIVYLRFRPIANG